MIGAGASGSNLLLAISKHKNLINKRILWIDKSFDTSNLEQNYSFWEEGNGDFDHLLEASWSNAIIKNGDETIKKCIEPYSYKSLTAQKFRSWAQEELEKRLPNLQLLEAEVTSFKNEDFCHSTRINNKTYQSKYFFDSRIETKDVQALFHTEKAVLQHFRGWLIETERDFWNTDAFTMMDFSIAQNKRTEFIYVLPYSSRLALIENTYFTSELVSKAKYDDEIKIYLDTQINLPKYKVKGIENGIIPMSTTGLFQPKTKGHIKIGTAAGWVKPSTGYSFKLGSEYGKEMAKLLAEGQYPEIEVSKKFVWYDDILLRILKNENHKTPNIFIQMFKKNPPKRFFKFLDNQSHWIEDIKIILSLNPAPFIRALINKYLGI